MRSISKGDLVRCMKTFNSGNRTIIEGNVYVVSGITEHGNDIFLKGLPDIPYNWPYLTDQARTLQFTIITSFKMYYKQLTN